MENFYIMHRSGQFKPMFLTPNQCKSPDWTNFHYKLSMIFPGNIRLNEQQFILDHADVDACVRGCQPEGSCETMHKQIAEAVENLMKKLKVRMLYCKCTITPDPSNPIAYLTHVQVHSPKYLALAPLAN